MTYRVHQLRHGSYTYKYIELYIVEFLQTSRSKSWPVQTDIHVDQV